MALLVFSIVPPIKTYYFGIAYSIIFLIIFYRFARRTELANKKCLETDYKGDLYFENNREIIN